MEFIASLLDSMDALIYVADMATYEILYINTYGRKIWGDVMGQICYRVLQKNQDGPCAFCTNKMLLDWSGNPGETFVWEFQNTITGLWYQCRDSAIKWHDGRIVRLEIATDITSRKRTEFQIIQLGLLKERLLGTQPLLQKLRDITDTSIIIFDIDLTCIWLYRDLYQYSCGFDTVFPQEPESPDEVDTSLYMLLHSSKNSDINTIPCIISFSHTPKEPEVQPVSKDKRKDVHSLKLSYYLIDWAEKQEMHSSHPFPLIDEIGNIIGYMVFFRKKMITPEDQQVMTNLVHTTSQVIISGVASKALARTKEKYRILVENLPQGIFLKDSTLQYISCNKRFADDVGVPQREIAGKTEFDLFPNQIAEIVSKLDATIIRSKKTEETVYECIQNNQVRYIKTVRTPLIDIEGKFSGILGFMQDITDMKLAQEELQCLYNELEVRVEARTEELLQTQEAYHKANSKLNLLNSVTRHDIVNQITALYGYLELSRESVSDTMTLSYLQKAEKSVQIIQDQILFTKLYQDIGVHAPVWQNVQDVVERVLSGLKNDSIVVSLSFNKVCVYADPLLEKVFYTLIDNAMRHGKGITHISFGNTYENNTLIIWCEDNGTGIKTIDKERIFDRGYGNNTGLGLFLAKEILNITGLSICETGIPGKGARFEIIVQKDAYQVFYEIPD